MINAINNIRENYTFLNMRIGIHTGKKIIGGIIGTDVVRYDVYGKDPKSGGGINNEEDSFEFTSAQTQFLGVGVLSDE